MSVANIARSEPDELNIPTDVLMQRLVDALGGGYTWLVSGTVNAEQWPTVAAAFRESYPTIGERDRVSLASRKARSASGAHRLFAKSQAQGARVKYFLMASTRDDQQPWTKANSPYSRPRLEAYVAMPVSTFGTTRPAWTWQFSRAANMDFREKLIRAIRCGDTPARTARLTALLAPVAWWPEFDGIEKQHASYGRLLRDEWARAAHSGEPCPAWPPLRFNTK